jgi:hypothetical protein
MKCVENVQQAALASPGIVFYPASDTYKLIDFAYSEMDPNNVVHLHSFQVTEGNSHKTQKELIEDHEEAIRNANPHAKSSLYFMVLPTKFEEFETTPKRPKATFTSVFILDVPAPNQTMWKLED